MQSALNSTLLVAELLLEGAVIVVSSRICSLTQFDRSSASEYDGQTLRPLNDV